MGQKVNPVGMRIGISRDWNSRWYANNKDFSKFLAEDIKIRNFLIKELKDCLVSHIEIDRIKGGLITVSIFTARPGMVLGQEAAKIKELTKKVQKLIGIKVKKDEKREKDIKLSVVEVKNPALDASIVAQEMAKSLEERASFRNVQKSTLRKVMKGGAVGVKTMVSGRLAGADIARSEGYKEGVVSLHTLRMDVDYACAEAATTYGKLGCKVWISRGQVVRSTKKDEENNSIFSEKKTNKKKGE